MDPEDGQAAGDVETARRDRRMAALARWLGLLLIAALIVAASLGLFGPMAL